MSEVHITYSIQITLNHTEICYLKQILERADSICTDLGVPVETFQQRLLCQLPKEV